MCPMLQWTNKPNTTRKNSIDKTKSVTNSSAVNLTEPGAHKKKPNSLPTRWVSGQYPYTLIKPAMDLFVHLHMTPNFRFVFPELRSDS